MTPYNVADFNHNNNKLLIKRIKKIKSLFRYRKAEHKISEEKHEIRCRYKKIDWLILAYKFWLITSFTVNDDECFQSWLVIRNQFEHITYNTPIRSEQEYRSPGSAESTPKLNYYACFNHYYGVSNWKQKFACSVGTPIENLIWKITHNWRG